MSRLKRRLLNDDEKYIKILEDQNDALSGKLDSISKLLGDTKFLTEDGSREITRIILDHQFIRPSWFKGDASCDWNEDAKHENGYYNCKCMVCDADFLGYKGRLICRKCHRETEARYEAMSPTERKEFDERRDAEIIKAFSEISDAIQEDPTDEH